MREAAVGLPLLTEANTAASLLYVREILSNIDLA